MPNRPGQGPKPKPTALKLLTGNPGGRPLNTSEPRYEVRLPTIPGHLNAAAKREWRRVGALLLAQGVMTDADRAALAAYCVTYARWAQAEAQIRGHGLLVVSAKGALIPSPYLRIAEHAIEQMGRLMTDLGLTPSSRTRIHSTPRAIADPLEEFFGGAP